MAIDLSPYRRRLGAVRALVARGRVVELTGLTIRARLPFARVGEVVHVARAGGVVPAEVVGFKDETVVLMPLGDALGVGPESEVVSTGRPLTVRVGEGLRGRLLDGLGRPIDGGPPPAGLVEWPVERECPEPLRRRRIERPLALGIKAIDGLCTVGVGQRLGLFAGSGVGKSTLLGQIARQAKADIAVVALVGERGREVREFVEDALGSGGLGRSVVVCATSDQPALVRLRAAFVATAIAEYFREQGGNVLFMLDSLTRLARAQREIGLAVGEPPARQGYPPSVFSLLPRLLERTGNSDRGWCTAIYTVLVAGGDMEEPIADEVRGILDGHIVLNRALAERNHWPAIDPLASLSRVMAAVTTEEHRAAAGRIREVLATYEKSRDLIALGAYRAGSDARLDDAIARIGAIEAFLRQRADEAQEWETTVRQMQAL